jgi:Phospholipase_D-nuclease N-terminal
MWIAVFAAGFVVFCLVDLVRAKQVRYLPKWAWAILCMGIGLTIPFGGILYLTVGRVRHPRPSGTGRPQANSALGGSSAWRPGNTETNRQPTFSRNLVSSDSS